MNKLDLERWLEAYGAAWQDRDADAAAALFTADALYRETPFREPFRGRQAIHDYWAGVTSDQADTRFGFEILALTGALGFAQWSARFRSISGDLPIELNGMFVLEFADPAHVLSLREWWHVR